MYMYTATVSERRSIRVAGFAGGRDVHPVHVSEEPVVS